MSIFPNDLIVLREAIAYPKLEIGRIGCIRRVIGPDEFEIEFVNDRAEITALLTLTSAQFTVPRQVATMTEADFWQMLDEAKANSASLLVPQTLRNRLAHMPLPEILAFGDIAERLHDHAYRNELWAACFIIGNGGCSNDGFYDFRDWLIEQGQAIYYNALNDPESLVDHVQLVHGDYSNFGDVEPFGITRLHWEAYQEKTGEEFPTFVGRGNRPKLSGEAWDQATVYLKYPRLAAKFWSH